ncbi:DUF3483 domain-containing protein [Komagataeibacter sp. FNDCF1]|uniref:DUF3483 domain-containing protein n=1 Tax=Komagataeibacter sp. FNDCF1 TaxID=2878681 RepID=UPI001E33047B|nr:DUF3483 domain-containing protein [Komagataeibacter sp. FNDCF1]MCE2565254.1 (Fe-S)-binding protein [Komagataeibacter sp. FNDCF1]
MRPPSEFALVVIMAGFLGAGIQALRVERRWRAGQAAAVDWWAGLRALPRRYMRDVHNVVLRQPRAARMHASLAGGFVICLALAVLSALFASRLAGIAAIPFLALLLSGIILQIRRRVPLRPRNLSGGAFAWLSVGFVLSFLFFSGVLFLSPVQDFSVAQRYAYDLAMLMGACGCGWLVAGMRRGPMRHVVAGTVHLVAHPRPARFGGRPDTALQLLDLDGERLGVSSAADFRWNQLAGFDACIQCGRCELACPAFAAGMPLNPKRLIFDLSAGMDAAGTALHYAGSPAPGLVGNAVAAGPAQAYLEGGNATLAPDTLWACTTCRACVYECPMMIEHVDAVIDLRRAETLVWGQTPGKGAQILDNLRMTDTAGGHDCATRLDWAAGLGLPQLEPGQETDCLWWLGEAAFDRRNQRTLRQFAALLRMAGVSFAVMPPGMEQDCGDLARRLGEEALFQEQARGNIARLNRLSFRRIVTLDPHAFHVLKREYPALGGVYAVLHHTELLHALLAAGQLVVSAPFQERVTYHDPCYLGRYNAVLDAPRAVLRAACTDLVEMERSGMRSSCCGGGGGAPVTDIQGERRIPDMRMDHIRKTGARHVAVACPFCAQMLEGVTGTRPEVADVVEILATAVGIRT